MVIPTLDLEQELWRTGFNYVCGIDEVGRGAFAGPVCVGSVIFPKTFKFIDGVADSKLLKPKRREWLAEEIKKQSLCWSVAETSVPVINKIGIAEATQMAFRKSVKDLSVKADFVLIDAFYIKHFNRKQQKAVKDGDKICYSIAAASIIAKVHRDKLMEKLDLKYPQYGFAKHKGYGTKEHREAIKRYGLEKVHRTSFNLQKFL